LRGQRGPPAASDRTQGVARKISDANWVRVEEHR